MVDSGFNIPTVVAREVEGDSPSWYNPNQSYKTVLIVSSLGGKSFLVNMDDLPNLDFKKMSQEDRLKVLSSYGTNGSRTQNNYKVNGDSEMDRIIRKVSNNRQTAVRQAVVEEQSVKQPQIAVEFRLKGVPARFTCYYHDAIAQDQYLILIQDKRAMVGQQLDLDPGTETTISVIAKGIKNQDYIASGLVFSYDNKQFSIYVVKDTEVLPAPQNLEEKFPEVEAGYDISDQDLLEEIRQLEQFAQQQEDTPEEQ